MRGWGATKVWRKGAAAVPTGARKERRPWKPAEQEENQFLFPPTILTTNTHMSPVAGWLLCGAICARGGGGGMAAVLSPAMLRKQSGRWLQSLCSSHSRWLQWLCPSHLTQNGCDIASSAMRARPGAGGMAAAASFQPSLVRMAALCVSQPSGWRLWLHCS